MAVAAGVLAHRLIAALMGGMTTQPRVAAGVPDGGQFSAQTRSSDGITLPAQPTSVTPKAVIAPQLTVNPAPMPEWPAGLDEPTLTVGLNDSDGGFYLGLTVGENQIGFWSDYDGQANSIWNGIESTDLDPAVEEKVIEWGNEAWRRADRNVAAVTQDALDALGEQIIASATGKSVDEVRSVNLASDYNASEADRCAEQGRIAASLFGDVESDGTHVADTIANLMLHARQNGWDFDELVDRAARYADDAENGAI